MAADAPTTWTTPSDILDAWIGDDAPDDEALVQAWIGRAERMIRREVPTLRARVDAGMEPDLLDTIRDVVAAVVTRVLRNPAGHRTIAGSTTTGPFAGNESITFGGENPGALELTRKERDALRPPEQARTGKITVIPAVSRLAARHVPWCSTTWGAPCSCGADIAGRPIYEGSDDEVGL